MVVRRYTCSCEAVYVWWRGVIGVLGRRYLGNR